MAVKLSRRLQKVSGKLETTRDAALRQLSVGAFGARAQTFTRGPRLEVRSPIEGESLVNDATDRAHIDAAICRVASARFSCHGENRPSVVSFVVRGHC